MIGRTGPGAFAAIGIALGLIASSVRGEEVHSASDSDVQCPATPFFLAVATRSDHGVRLLDPTRGERVAALATGRVSNRGSNTLTVIDTRTDSAMATVPAGGEFPGKLAFSPDGRTVWVSNVDAQEHTVACRLSVGRDADGVVWYTPSPVGSENRYLEAAQRIAAWLTALRARWAEIPDDAMRPGASASLAEGAAGIALFLHELALVTEDSADARSATRAVDRVLDRLPGEMTRAGFPPHTGLYYGAPGLAAVLLRAYTTDGDARYLDAVRDVIAWLLANEGPEEHRGWTAFNDVLFGDAGTALFLLDAAEALGDDLARQRAAAAGRALIRRARPRHGGIYWVLREGSESNLPNFSHGTAGIGFLMARLYEATSDTTFLRAALAAARYLDAIAVPDPEFLRIPYGFERPEWAQRHDPGWAHGAAGTARFYEQLARVTGDSRWRARVRAADRTARAAVPDEGLALDRRFGLAGIADFQLDLATESDAGTALAAAGAMADRILADATVGREGLYWIAPRPSFMSGAGDPGALTGLLHGAAGQGLLLLRLHVLTTNRTWSLRLPDSPWPARPRR